MSQAADGHLVIAWCKWTVENSVCVDINYGVKKHFSSLKITASKWGTVKQGWGEQIMVMLSQFSMAILSQIVLSNMTVFLRQMWSIGVWICAQIAPDPGKQQGHMHASQFPAQSTGVGWAPDSTPLELTPVHPVLPGVQQLDLTALTPTGLFRFSDLRIAKDITVGYGLFPVGKRYLTWLSKQNEACLCHTNLRMMSL